MTSPAASAAIPQRKTPPALIAPARVLAVLQFYVKRLGFELHEDAFIFRTRSGTPYGESTMGDDFRAVRAAAFGPSETRKLSDFRRLGAQEAFAGGARPADVSHAMANTIATSNALFATYNPVNLVSIKNVQDARLVGRQKIRSQANRPGAKVGTTRLT